MKLSFEFSPVQEIKNAFSGEAYTRLKNNLLALMMNQKDMVFRNQASPDGQPWLPLGGKSQKRRDKKNSADRKGQVSILTDTGTLKNSISVSGAANQLSSIDGDTIELGTNVVYAAAQNFGATIIAGERSQIGTKKILHATKIVIPARPFMGIGQQDEAEITETIEHFMNASAAT